MKKRTIIGLAVIAAAVATMFAAPSVALATDAPECQRGYVSITWERGTGNFTGKTINGGPDCGVRLTSYVGVERQLTAGDYSHPQVAKEWAWAQLTATESRHSVALPACDNVQVDAYTGPFQFDLPHGDLGSAWVAGGVIERAGQECEAEPQPEETVTPEPTEPPVPVPPVTTPEVPSSPVTPPNGGLKPTPLTPTTVPPTPVTTPNAAGVTLTPVQNVAPSQRTAQTCQQAGPNVKTTDRNLDADGDGIGCETRGVAPVPTPIRTEAKFTG